ncbi:hypothetical protein HNR23_004739 [Nocardiopsis mwathae]|uniref:Uncharacterized protein n=1 Tax=Nocardiopsis mwathae TaxID=1472723 RepID=A0A7X0D945_9ACTN|nr:hypothetical protein [Nocardiopsis mwathae]
MDTQLVKRSRYPFPTLVNEYASAIQEPTDRHWIDDDCRGLVASDIADGFKRSRTTYTPACFFPMATWERLLPLARVTLSPFHQDNIYERATPEQVRRICESTIAIDRGQHTPDEAGVILGGLIAVVRCKVRRFVPERRRRPSTPQRPVSQLSRPRRAATSATPRRPASTPSSRWPPRPTS